MKKMRYPRSGGVFGRVALRAMEDARYEREIDACWPELRKVFDANLPDTPPYRVQAAEAVIMRALAEDFCPNPPAPAKP